MARCRRPCQFNNLHNFCLKFAMIQPVLQEGNLWNVTVDFCVIFFVLQVSALASLLSI